MGGGYRFTNQEAADLVARFTTPPDNARKALIDTMVGVLKAAGVWSKLDALYIMAAHDSRAARRNWIADAYNLTPTSSPTFTADQGYAGDGSTSYLSTGFNPATAVSPKFVQNSAHLAAWSRTQLQGENAVLGNSNSLLTPRSGSDAFAARVNGNSGQNVGSANPSLLTTSGRCRIVRRTVSRIDFARGRPNLMRMKRDISFLQHLARARSAEHLLP